MSAQRSERSGGRQGLQRSEGPRARSVQKGTRRPAQSKPCLKVDVYTSPNSIIAHQFTFQFETAAERLKLTAWLFREVKAGRIKANFETISRTSRTVRSVQHTIRRYAGICTKRRSR